MPTDELPEGATPAAGDSVRPTYAPIAMAMGIAMTTWGLVALSLNISALWFMSLFGVGLSAWALKSWIDEIVRNWEANR